MHAKVEVCCGGFADVMAAYYGGAARVELNSALCLGGLTPSVACLELAKERCGLEMVCMVRPRPAGFSYSTLEFEQMRAEAAGLLAAGSDGIAFGVLADDRTVDASRTLDMVGEIHDAGAKAVFHRAFDLTPDPFAAMETLVGLGVDRVLTSGQRAYAPEGADLIAELQCRFGDDVEILPGAGVNASNARGLVCETGVGQVHSSCRELVTDETTSGESVSLACHGGHGADEYGRVSKELVAGLVGSLS